MGRVGSLEAAPYSSSLRKRVTRCIYTSEQPSLFSFDSCAQVLDKRHKHELIPSAAPFHVTRAASSAEAALEAAKALHVTEAQHGGGVPYDDDDLG